MKLAALALAVSMTAAPSPSESTTAPPAPVPSATPSAAVPADEGAAGKPLPILDHTEASEEEAIAQIGTFWVLGTNGSDIRITDRPNGNEVGVLTKGMVLAAAPAYGDPKISTWQHHAVRMAGGQVGWVEAHLVTAWPAAPEGGYTEMKAVSPLPENDGWGRLRPFGDRKIYAGPNELMAVLAEPEAGETLQVGEAYAFTRDSLTDARPDLWRPVQMDDGQVGWIRAAAVVEPDDYAAHETALAAATATEEPSEEEAEPTETAIAGPTPTATEPSAPDPPEVEEEDGAGFDPASLPWGIIAPAAGAALLGGWLIFARRPKTVTEAETEPHTYEEETTPAAPASPFESPDDDYDPFALPGETPKTEESHDVPSQK